jgi:hypothetical protein
MQENAATEINRCSGQLNGNGVYCHLRFDCLRFLRFTEVDKTAKKKGHIISPAPFEGFNCPLFIKSNRN